MQALISHWDCYYFLLCFIYELLLLIFYINCASYKHNMNTTTVQLTSLVAQTVKCLSTMWETWVQALGWEDPLEKEMAIHSSTIAWKSRGQRSLVGCSLWGRKESDMTERLHFTSPFWNHVEGIKHSSVSGLWKEFVLIVRISINIYCSMHWFTPSPAFCVISGAGNLLVDVRPLFWEQSRDHTLAGQKVCIML